MRRSVQQLALVALLVAGCSGIGPTINVAPTPAPAPEGWQYQGWTEPSLQLAVPADWEATTFEVDEAPPPDPSAGPEARAIETAVLNAWHQDGYRVNIGGDILTPLGTAGPGYIEAFVEVGSWPTLDAFAAHWEAVAREFDGRRVGEVRLPAGQAIVIEVDDTVDDNPDRMLRARWYLFLLPDGRGMNITVGTYPDGGGGREAATMDALRSFADRAILTLRPAPPGE